MTPNASATTPVRWHVVNSPDQLPVIGSFYSVIDGPLPLNDADRQVVLLAKIRSGATVLFAVETDDKSEAVATTLTRARHAGIAITAHYKLDEDVFDVLARQAHQGTGTPRTANLRSDVDPLIDEILLSAANMGATDVHSIGHDNGATMLVRVHGEILRDQPLRQLTSAEHERLARAFFVREEGRADKDWNADSWLDASLTRSIGGREYALRFSQRNNHSSFNFSLRLQPIRDAMPTTFAELGYLDWQARAYENALRDPRGIVLLVGEMNSGKSTTLAASLVWLRDTFPGRLIQTLENPIEYRIKGINQASISERGAGDDDKWDAAFRGLVRSDAQIIMVGEIRDGQSAREAQRIATTGHKFLSTIHAPTPIMALRRLVKEGADPQLLFSDRFVSAVVAQRLLRRLCPCCSITILEAIDRQLVSRDLVDGIRAAAPEHAVSVHGVRVRARKTACDGCGEALCRRCGGQGIIGMTVAAGLLVPDRKLNELMLAGAFDEAEAQWLARKAGVPSGAPLSGLLEHGLYKMFQGEVCPNDVSDNLGPLTKDIHRLSPRMPGELRLVGEA